jgi:hypothetical protein
MGNIHVASEFPCGNTELMELLITVLILVLLAMLAAGWGVDSRPLDIERPTRWWPATPRD